MDDQGRPSYLAVVSPFPSTWSKSHHLKNNRVGMAAGQLGQEVLHGDEHEGIQFWKSYFEFSYYLLVCPFRFEWDCKRRTYHCHTNKVQTALHYGVFGIFGSYYLLRLRAMWNTTSILAGLKATTTNKENPTAYFDMAVYFFDSFFMLILFLHFGRQKHKVFQVFKEFQFQSDNEASIFPRYRRFNSLLGYHASKYRRTRLWSTLILMGCMSTVVIKFLEVLQNDGWDLAQFFRRRTEESKIIFLESEDLVEAAPWLFVFLNIGSTLYEKVLNDLGDILFTMSVLFLTNLVDSFVITLRNGSEPNMVVEQYKWLKKVTSAINRAIGTMTFAFIAGNLPFFATTVLEVFGTETKNVFVRIRYIVACLYFFPSICIGARANKKAQ
ncbi:hypothetical protein Fcan01_07084 [Folsomia candida]|uniref:Uncharacterized protein n=1 Tax=Folsomia candida TaxID=158441 RepID=A0A226EN55_FOLCA|nr:hypothetical protein Fcan01_07084 [Folsomia candida]